MPQIRIEAKGIEELIKKNKNRILKKFWDMALAYALEKGEKRSKDLCPVDTGYMRSQIRFKKLGNLHYRFSCDCAYASFNEWGWYGIPPVGEPTAPKHYKGGYRPFMRSGLLIALKHAKKKISYIIKYGNTNY